VARSLDEKRCPYSALEKGELPSSIRSAYLRQSGISSTTIVTRENDDGIVLQTLVMQRPQHVIGKTLAQLAEPSDEYIYWPI
jgi:hypothetical protein